VSNFSGGVNTTTSTPPPCTRIKFKRHSLTHLSTFIFRPSELQANDSNKSGADDSLYVMNWKKNFFYCINLFVHSVRSFIHSFNSHHGTLIHSSIHSNKENEPPSLLDRNRRTSHEVENPYVTRKKVPTKSSIAFSQESFHASSAQIDEESPTIKRILKAKGCSSVEELLARDQQKTQANHALNGPRAATNRATNQAKAAPNGPKATTNGSKSMNRSKSTNRSTSTIGSKARNVATNGAKATNGSKSTTNPKKKAKSKYLYFY